MRVRLFGTLSQGFPGYRHAEGFEVEIPEEAMAEEFLAVVGVPESRGAVVAVAGRVLKADDSIGCGSPVHVLQVLHGG